ncbi:MAG: nucleotidyltransferase domain-containing protein [Romboutsia sp.]
MRNLGDRIKKLIIAVLNCNITDAIYVFGSYGTEYYEEGVSDIDIAWFTSKKIDLVKRSKFRDILEEVLDISVDLVIVDKNSTDHLLYNIFETGECIFIGSKEFESWFDYFYDSTYLDREFLSIYMEEKNRYVQY